MAANTTLNARNLQTLGAGRLAELLIEISMGSAAAKRRLRIELAGIQSSGEVARQVTKRLVSIERSRSKVSWRRIKALKADLEIQRHVILDTLAKDDPEEALEVMWRFISLAPLVLARCNDGNGTIAGVFDTACRDLGQIAGLARPNPALLADRVFAVLQDNDDGPLSRLIEILAPALGSEGLDHLKQLFMGLHNLPVEQPDEDYDPQSRSAGDHESRHQRMRRRIGRALEQIADAQGDVDAFIFQQGQKARSSPLIAAQMGVRLIKADRAQEALEALDAAGVQNNQLAPFEWQAVRADALETIGRKDEAQLFRWQCFAQSLDERHLRAFLKRLPDFDDLEAEEKAIGLALHFPDANRALAFLVAWPSLGKAADLVLLRHAEFDEEDDELLANAGGLLGEKYPDAAIQIYRGIIDHVLNHGKTSRYRQAASLLEECARLCIKAGEGFNKGSHEHYLGVLRRKHETRRGFWKRVG